MKGKREKPRKVEIMKQELPNDIDLELLAKLLIYSDRYQISVQFWPDLTSVYIMKDCIDLNSFSGEFQIAVQSAIYYLDRINRKPTKKTKN